MRTSPLHAALQAYGPARADRFGVEVATSYADEQTEYRRIRDAVGVTDFSCMQVYRIPEATGVDFLDSLVAGNVAKIRFGRVLHTFLADDDGMLLSDCYVANNDEELLVMCESAADDGVVDGLFMSGAGREAGIEKLTGASAVLGVDGYRAWAVARELFGADVLGLPYLSVEMCRFDGEDIRLVRAGKTSEFGYLLIVPAAVAAGLLSAAHDSAAKQGGGMCGVEIHNSLRLEGRFFNIFGEGVRVRDPLVLGLQWMVDLDKAGFRGRDAIMARRGRGVERKVVGVKASGSALRVGDRLFDEREQVAEVVSACRSYVLDGDIGLAIFPVSLAYSGLEFRLGAPDGPAVATISMPPIMPKSLTVKLDEL